MELLRVFLYALGGVMLLGLLAICRQLGAEYLFGNKRWIFSRGSIEGWILFLASSGLAAFYLKKLYGAGGMPGIESRWLVGYAACCGVYLAAKGIRMARVR
jgi:hypothetical protein